MSNLPTSLPQAFLNPLQTCPPPPLPMLPSLPPYAPSLPPYAPSLPPYAPSLPPYAPDLFNATDSHRRRSRSRSRSRDSSFPRFDSHATKMVNLDAMRQQRLNAMSSDRGFHPQQQQQPQPQQQQQYCRPVDRGFQQPRAPPHPFGKVLSFSRSLLMDLYLVNDGRFLDIDSTCCSSPFKYSHFSPNNVRFCVTARDAAKAEVAIQQQQQHQQQHQQSGGQRSAYAADVVVVNLIDGAANPAALIAEIFDTVAPESLDAIVSLKGLQDFVTNRVYLVALLQACFDHLCKGGHLVGTMLSGTILQHYLDNIPSYQQQENGIRIQSSRGNNTSSIDRFPLVDAQFPFYRCSNNSCITDQEFLAAAKQVGFEVQIAAPLKEFLKASAETAEYERLSRQFFRQDKTEIDEALKTDLHNFFRIYVLTKE